MNKAILAACAGVTFGLFVGGVLLSGRGSIFLCQKRARSVSEVSVEQQQQTSRRVIIERRIVRSSGGTIHSEMTQITTQTDGSFESEDKLTQAQMAYVRGDHAQAIAIAKTAISESPIRARRIIGSAACQTKDAKLIAESYSKLDGPSRQYLLYVCQRNGVTIRGNEVILDDKP